MSQFLICHKMMVTSFVKKIFVKFLSNVNGEFVQTVCPQVYKNDLQNRLKDHCFDMPKINIFSRYLFDFLGTDAPRREAELKRRLIEHIQKFLLELGQGFAFVGR